MEQLINDSPQVFHRKRDAAFGRRVAGTSYMHKDCAATAAYPRPIVVAQDKHDVVEGVRSHHGFAAATIRNADRSVVISVAGIVAPTAVIPVVGGSLALGTWQSLVMVDPNADNPRRQVRFSFIAG